ncbi:MAG TPA: ABC transporter permease [Gemmataceae bacterium]|nr:ABC transporter permease [Gemmataceae bacterium]
METPAVSSPELESETAPDTAVPRSALPITTIRPRSGWRVVDFGELWRFRELLFFLTWRDVKVRYKQTALGALWALLQPFATMVVFSLFLGKTGVAGGDAAEVPYPLFVFAGLLPWVFFANAVSGSSQSVVVNERLVTKIYFPRLIIPMAAIGATLVDFVIAFGMLLIMMVYYSVAVSWTLFLLPLMVLGLLIAVIGTGALLSALTVAYRDFRHATPFLVQLWMFATPSIYLQNLSRISPVWQNLLPLNPAYGLISNFRLAMLGKPLDLYALAVSSGVAVFLLIVGCLYFRRVEDSFADII